MTNSSDYIQRAFDASAGTKVPLRPIVLEELPALRKANTQAYWDYIRETPGPTSADLETMLPQATLPQIVDGLISYRCVDFMSPTKAIVERETTSYSKTAAAQFLSLIERLERDDPEFLAEYAESLFSSSAVDYVMAFHHMGERADVKELFLKRVKNMDDLVIAVMRRKEQFLDNDHYPMGNTFSRLTDTLATEYILRKAPFMDGRTYASDEEMRPFLEIARDYCHGSKVIEAINTKFPLPKSLVSIHGDGLYNIKQSLCDDMEMANWMLDRRERYADLTDDEKFEFGKYYLWLLAKSYGVGPPPELILDPTCSSVAAMKVWNINKRDECFAHPLGKILIQEFSATPEKFLESLSHEFAHSLEDLALFSINPDFQDWCERNPGLVEIGDETMQKNLRSAALSISFNSAASSLEAFAGLRNIGSNHGAYYQELDAGVEADEAERKKMEALYISQLRERHAYGYEGILSGRFNEALDMIKESRDSLHVFMMAQNAMFKASAYIKEHFIPSIPPDLHDRYAMRLDKIQHCFKAADARELTYRKRLDYMGYAFGTMHDLISEGVDGDFIDAKSPEANAVKAEALKVHDHAFMGIRFIDWKKQKDTAAGEMAPAPAAV